MKKPEEIFEILKEKFGEDVISIDTELPVEPIITVSPNKIDEISLFLRDEKGLEFDSLMNLSGVDDANGKKVKQEDGSTTIEGHTLSVYYHLYSYSIKHKVAVKVSVPVDEPKVKSVEHVWGCANWHEREAYDLIGIVFENNSDLRRILLPDDWEGHPLRKDYVTPETYNGMKIKASK